MLGTGGMKKMSKMLATLLILLTITGSVAAEENPQWKLESTKVITSSAESDRNALKWTRSQILEMADREVRRLGVDVERMSVSFDYENRPWVLRANVGDVPWINPELAPLREKLKARPYLAVMYGPIQEQIGGEVVVFIDRETGEVIDTFIPKYGPQGTLLRDGR